MQNRGELVSNAYKAAKLVNVEGLKEYPLSVLKQVKALIGRHSRNGHGAWEEPLWAINEAIEQLAK
ncbi:hypothetical protein ABHN11_24730 [Brevibacillus centrosporus]|uniref:hypothetical protein n=1 Tax=Brevibacillus centrosporus TaxID=54910 RepID=UPI003D23C6D7